MILSIVQTFNKLNRLMIGFQGNATFSAQAAGNQRMRSNLSCWKSLKRLAHVFDVELTKEKISE